MRRAHDDGMDCVGTWVLLLLVRYFDQMIGHHVLGIDVEMIGRDDFSPDSGGFAKDAVKPRNVVLASIE